MAGLGLASPKAYGNFKGEVSVMKKVCIAAVALLVAGCGSSIEGDWEADGIGCGDIEMSVLEDEKVELDYPIPDGGGGCFTCKFEGDYTEKDNGDYEFDLSPQSPCTGPDLEGDCKLSDDGEELECEVDGGDDVEFKKVN